MAEVKIDMKEISVVLCTCDAYSDLWDGFFYLFRKYWPDFQGEIILNTETKEYSCDNLKIIPLKLKENESIAWSNMLFKALSMCKSEQILLVLDDFFFVDYVNTKRFEETRLYMQNHKEVKSITYFYEMGGTNRSAGLPGFVYRKHFTPYKMTAHLTLYDRDFLKSILRDGENAWEFEVNGTVRSWVRRGTFLCLNQGGEKIFPYDGDFVRHGKFIKERKDYFEKNEGICFSEERGVLENLDSEMGSGTLRKKIYYGMKGLRSFAKPRIKTDSSQ